MTQKDGKDRVLPKKHAHGLGLAAVGISAMAAASLLRKSHSKPPAGANDNLLSPAVSGERRMLQSASGGLSYYVSGETSSKTPLLLLHSVNAAGSAYEVRPLYDHYAGTRPVYALDLPGFGFSERSDRLYLPRLMTDAIHAMVEEIGRRHGPGPIDALALSLSCEFLGRAASERPASFRTLALVSPTGFTRRTQAEDTIDETRGMPPVRNIFRFKLWSRPFFNLLTTRTSIRYFLQKTWGSKNIDEGLLEYDYRTTHQPNAEHVVYCFVSGFLFSKAIPRIYAGLAMPVFMVHGTRGDFVDYRNVQNFRDKPNWTIQQLDTGALPQFEMLGTLVAAYEAFLAKNTENVAIVATP